MARRRTKRSDGRYSVNARLERPHGTQRRVYFYGRTQAEARAKANAALERAAVGAPIRDATRSVSDWLSEWRETFLLASDRAVSTKSLYAGLTQRHVEPVIGQLAGTPALGWAMLARTHFDLLLDTLSAKMNLTLPPWLPSTDTAAVDKQRRREKPKVNARTNIGAPRRPGSATAAASTFGAAAHRTRPSTS